MSSYRAIWTLNADETIAAGSIQGYLQKTAQVFFPLNTQYKDIDLSIRRRQGDVVEK